MQYISARKRTSHFHSELYNHTTIITSELHIDVRTLDYVQQDHAYNSTVEPGYNDTGLYDTSSIASDILWYQLIPHF
jgi:hypothetical protein